MVFELRPHQEVAVAKMHNGCILCGGVGVGKTHTAVQYYLNNEAPKPVYVITTAKKRDKGDWQDVWSDVGMHWNPELTLGAVVIVDSWENIKKYEEVKDAFFIFDEQRLVGTGAWVKAFYKISQANRWIMLSATPGDNWLDYVPVFRANGFIKNITQFKEEHVVQRWTGRYYQVIGYRQVPKLVKWRNQLLVDMPYDKHTTRHTHEVHVEYDQELVRRLVKDRWHVYEDRPLTDASELFRVMRKVVYSDASRLEAIRRLIQTHPKLIVFYNFDYELEILRTLSNSDTTQSISSKEVFSQDQKMLGSPGHPEPSTRSRSSSEATSRMKASSTPARSSSSRTTTGKSSLRTTTPRQPTGGSEGSWTNDEGKGEVWIPETCPTKEALRTSHGSSAISRSTMESSGTSTQTCRCTPGTTCDSSETDESILFEQTLRVLPQTSTEDWQDARTLDTSGDVSTAIPSIENGDSLIMSVLSAGQQTTLSLSDPRDSDDWTYAMSDLLESSQLQTSGSMSAREDRESPYETHVGSVPTVDSRHQTPEKSGGPSESRSSSRTSSSEKVSSPIQTGSSTRPPINQRHSKKLSTMEVSQEHSGTMRSDDSVQTKSGHQSNDVERIAEWNQKSGSRRKSTSQSNPTNTPNDTSKHSDAHSSLEALRKKHFSEKSSRASSSTQASSTTGSASTSSPQFQVAEWNGHKHEEIPTTTSWVYLVQYVAGAEAWECVETDAIAFWSMPYSYKLWWQSHGRIDRLNTAFTDLHYYVLMSKAIIDKGVKKSLTLKKSFNESAFAKELGLN